MIKNRSTFGMYKLGSVYTFSIIFLMLGISEKLWFLALFSLFMIAIFINDEYVKYIFSNDKKLLKEYCIATIVLVLLAFVHILLSIVINLLIGSYLSIKLVNSYKRLQKMEITYWNGIFIDATHPSGVTHPITSYQSQPQAPLWHVKTAYTVGIHNGNIKLNPVEYPQVTKGTGTLVNSSIEGANENFVQGGKTAGGVSEVETDPIPSN